MQADDLEPVATDGGDPATVAADVEGERMARARGNPEDRRGDTVALYLTHDVAARVDAWRADVEATTGIPVSKSAAVVALLRRALDAEGVPALPGARLGALVDREEAWIAATRAAAGVPAVVKGADNGK